MDKNDKLHLFESENAIIRHAAEICEKEDVSPEKLKEELNYLMNEYEELLNQSKIITKVSDRLQNKFNNANLLLQKKNIELRHTIDELTKAKISKKATTLVLIIAIGLFIISEGLIEPIVEQYTKSFLVGFAFKGTIALLLKPIESLLESTMLSHAMARRRKEIDLEIAKEKAGNF
ncbi:MAG: hypothetical protein A3G23_14375 [Bacteroidetes bacterium RIFCSPLOWO2_12_FULL_37_12]|nr:MAG: hypothetical protein A3G23_14375 [Bacteroidetes bacterium RIFCSPLOWO2_12_FULL_37_12]